ncbi:endonuclease/exonuclease/phosphatase family protein [Lysobacter sp. N42]|uniref:endonuclease/exonuclease/phosphatase family protein n=1 Tax=Lysobacter sp. N42 TaxID=2545719 RepID=UPI00104DA31C|nr:endonuclease/exonuclease/phosphatase family protein [Lysobacter sp. N42]TCZ78986.1 endonuclease [Lysobacter sp. N42]
MKTRLLLAAILLATAACTGLPGGHATPAPGLTLASWNVEHLAERDGTGCRPRTAADYAAMRAHVERLDADVVAFQEVESRAAAERVFDPARWTVLVEERIGTPRTSACGGRAKGQTIRAQRTGFAIRKGLPFDRQPDLTALQLGDPDLRSGVDVILRPRGGQPLRLLSVHLKSGCSAGDRNEACPVLFRQVPVLEQWIDRRAAEGMRFAVLGDFNRRLALPGDAVWAEWDDASPANADLSLAAGDRTAQCNPRYRDFIDHIVLDRRAAADLAGFDEATYAGEALSDHCAISARLR